MKNPKNSGKGPSHQKGGHSHKGPSSSAAAATASGGAAPHSDRKTAWDREPNKPPVRPSDPNPSPRPRDRSAPSSAAAPAIPPHDRQALPPFDRHAIPPFDRQGLPPHDRQGIPPHDRQQIPPLDHPLHPPAAAGVGFPDFAAGPPAPPAYGFHNLDRRTIALPDGSLRTYFALPPDYPNEPAADRLIPAGRPDLGPGPGRDFDHPFPPPGGRFSPEDFREPPPFARGRDGPRGPPEGAPSSLLKRKNAEDEFAWHRQHVLQYGNPNGIPLGGGGDRRDFTGRSGSPLRREGYEDARRAKQPKLGGDGFDDAPPRRGRAEEEALTVEVDRQALKRAFLKFAKAINENVTQRKNYLEDGKSGPLKCIVCDRASKEFADVHGLVIHAYSEQNAKLRADHLGLHKALCVLMGWNYAKTPENSKAYQNLSAVEITSNREDLILWPPIVIIHNTNSGRRKDGRMDGMGNKEMDSKLKELGFGGGKAKSMYGKEGHLGVTLVKFANTQAGLKEAERLAEFFLKDNHGSEGWERVQASKNDDDDEKNPELVKVDEKTGDKKRIFYGYLATASDLEKIDIEARKKAVIKSRKEFDMSD